MLEGASVNELDALESDDLIPADNADSCHSSADEPEAVSIWRRLFRARRASAHRRRQRGDRPDAAGAP